MNFCNIRLHYFWLMAGELFTLKLQSYHYQAGPLDVDHDDVDHDDVDLDDVDHDDVDHDDIDHDDDARFCWGQLFNVLKAQLNEPKRGIFILLLAQGRL